MPETNNNNQTQSRTERIEAFMLDPEATIFQSLDEFEASIGELLSRLQGLNPEELNQLVGKDGYTPQRGVDYMTEEDIQGLEQFILSKIPKVGIELPSRLQVEDFVRAEVAKIPRVSGPPGKDGSKGADGKDGSPDTPEQIITKLRLLLTLFSLRVQLVVQKSKFLSHQLGPVLTAELC